MAVQALYRKWRPQTFDEVVGQEHVIRTLRNALASERIHHAYLFAGPRGTGKTTTARLLAKAVNCVEPPEQRPCNQCAICQAVNEGRLIDLIEIDAASNTGVDDVRELREKVRFRPNEARYKVYVIDEVHMLSNAAFNALLKTLEEPPPHAIFVLATTEPHKIPVTVLSRCQRFDFRRIPVGEIVKRLAWMTERESIETDPEALSLVARQATGSMRDAESLLDQLASYEEGNITVEDVRAALGTGTSETVMQVTDALARGDVAQGLSGINAAVAEGADPRQFARQMVEHLRVLLLLKLKSDVALTHVPEEMRPQLEIQAAGFASSVLVRAVRLFNQAAAEAKGGWQPQLPLEMAFIETVLQSGGEASPPGENSAPLHGATPTKTAHPPRPTTASASRHSPPSRAKANPGPSPSEQLSSPAQETVREPQPTYNSAAASDGALTPETLRGRWSEFLNALRPRNLPLEALMRSCEPVAIEGDVVVLGFAHDFHRSRVENEQNRQDVEEALAELIGQRYRVRCVLTQGESGPEVPRATTDDDTKQHGVIDDPLVRAAVEDLGAVVRQ
jgi:DNA polymerase-3 subunit gamma/tau